MATIEELQAENERLKARVAELEQWADKAIEVFMQYPMSVSQITAACIENVRTDYLTTYSLESGVIATSRVTGSE